MKTIIVIMALAISLGCVNRPVTTNPPPAPPVAPVAPTVAPEDQPPSPNAMTDLVITAEPTATVAPKALVVLLPNQYPGMPPRIGQVLQYCAHVCTWNWSGSMFGGARNPSNICMIAPELRASGATVTAHITQTNPDGFEMDTQLAPDGKSKCIFEAPQCTVSNGCLSAQEKKQCPSCGG
jgi:hypothetical protein